MNLASDQFVIALNKYFNPLQTTNYASEQFRFTKKRKEKKSSGYMTLVQYTIKVTGQK